MGFKERSFSTANLASFLAKKVLLQLHMLHVVQAWALIALFELNGANGAPLHSSRVLSVELGPFLRRAL